MGPSGKANYRKQIGQYRPNLIVGSGKTTLLDVLCGRVDQSRVTGKVLYNGCRFGPHLLNSLAYVEQHVSLYKTLTIREIVLYSAHLRIPSSELEGRYVETEVHPIVLIGRYSRQHVG